MNSPKSILATASILSAMAPAALAQKSGADTLKTQILNPVTVTGTGTFHKASDSPVAVNVITAKQLKDANVTSIQDALTKLTTNITTHTNGMGTFVNFNGVIDDYILILENGKRVSGDDRWNRISIDNIKRIEILSGAASALYGSDAIAGVINIITDEAKSHVSAESKTRLTSKGRFDQDINVDVNTGKFSNYISYNHKQADNWQVSNYQEFEEGSNTVLKLTGRPMSQGFRSENVSEKMQWNFSDKFQIYLRGNFYDNLTNRPQSATYFTQKVTTDKTTNEKTYSYTSKQAYTYDLHHTSFNYGAGARFVPNNNVHLYLDLYSDNFSSKYDYWQTAETEAYNETRKRTHYYNETLKGIFRLADWNKLSGGIEFVQEYLHSSTDNINQENTNTYNVFAQDEIAIFGNKQCGLDGVVGARYTYNSNFSSNMTGNAGLFFHANGFRARVSWASGYRTPTLSQLYATDQAKTYARYTINNTSLKPEKNNFWNANIEYSNNFMSISISGFINKIKDMINLRVLTDDEIQGDSHLTDMYNEGWTTIRQRDNIDNATIKGISTNVKFILPAGFIIGGGYTYTDSKAKTMSLDTKTQEYYITETPVDKCVKNVANVTASWDHSWKKYHLNVNIDGHIQGERYSSTYGYAPAYSQWDFNTRHIISLRHFVIEPGIGIENIFNKRDTSYWNSNFSTVNPGRALYVSCAFKFKD